MSPQHEREVVMQRQQIAELQAQIKGLHSLIASNGGTGGPGTPGSMTIMPSQAAALQQQNTQLSEQVQTVQLQHAQGMVQMQQVVTQQTKQIDLLLELQRHSVQASQAIATIASSPDMSRPGTGLALMSSTMPVEGSSPFGSPARDESKHGGTSGGVGSAFGESFGRSLDGRSPPVGVVDDVKSPSPSKRLGKNTPSTTGSKPSPSKKPTKSTVVSI
jgi:hypothetical protein